MPVLATLSLRPIARTHIGLVRSSNEDAFVLRPEAGVCAIADGMGGHEAGEVASAAAVQAAADVADAVLTGDQRAAAALFRTASARAHDACVEFGASRPAQRDLGSTLTMVWLTGSELQVLHIGDSAAYRWTGAVLDELTEDHTYVAKLVREGVISPEEALTHPRRNIIERCIGGGARYAMAADQTTVTVDAGDRLLLATDGLTDLVTDRELGDLCATYDDAETLADALIELALARGGKDNITVVVADVVDGSH